ncbi:ornithine aminomutase subunit alpha [Halothermothrix orenii]|uniref:D-Lysine 5,6-aminomutase alpha subunit domain-containing protein n=1 Tax=Halothermothrix orenii (strain H 168 / OCM 544 / DSM 9562) TaxID=373903 RepID=B8D001_HALOH|nr:ornithine aminomutase subunit alpha [Halothermothrix orenii]ACL70853.1 hypothetical protein Hore_21080 [Halothermothrix orenii H 168]
MGIKREDDFEQRRKHLKELSDKELNERFWQLTEKIVDPLLELARTHTSESIERSVLLRMGFNSLEAKAIVNKVVEAGLLGKGAGHVVLKLSQKEGIPVKEAGVSISQGKRSVEELRGLFEGGDRT